MLGRIRALGLIVMFSVTAGATPPRPSMPAATPLQAASGTLHHSTSISFNIDPLLVAKISGIESFTLARTSDGGAVRIVLDSGAPYPNLASVEILEHAPLDAGRIYDPHLPPSEMPPRAGYQRVSTFRLPGRNSYLAAWREALSGKNSLTIWDKDNRASEFAIVATSSSTILGVASQMSHHDPATTIVVWTAGRSAGDVVASMYRWEAHDR